MALKGTLYEEFEVKDGDISCYLARLDQFFIANDIEDTDANAAKRRAILLSSIGGTPYQVLTDLCFPEAPHEKTYDELGTLLKGHYKSPKIPVTERFKFHNFKQKEGQSIADYVKELNHMATYCEFTAGTLEENLKDRFICGLLNTSIQKKLLYENKDFHDSVRLAKAEEAARQNVKDMNSQDNNNGTTTTPVNKVYARKFRDAPAQPHSKSDGYRSRCDRCGLSNHSRDDCYYKNFKCFKCKQTGHLRSECRERNQNASSQQGNRQRKRSKSGQRQRIRYVDSSEDFNDTSDDNVNGNADDENSEFAHTIYRVNGFRNCKPIKIDMTLSGVILTMELDTGAAVTLISYEDYVKYFKNHKLEHSNKKLHTYAGTEIEVIGEIFVNVKYGDQLFKNLSICVTRAEYYAPPLLGRDWLNIIKLDWNNIFAQSQGQFTVNRNPEHELKSRYAEVFTEELVGVKGVTAHLHMKEDAQPVFCRPRPVAFALRPQVEKELLRLQKEGIIVPVEFSNWGTPLVCIAKSDGTVRICGDYKVSVNQHINTDQYPIPTPEEVYEKLSGGQKYSKIDLRCAYQQLILDEESQNVVTINTHKGLFRYTRLPFGVSSSPAIWQRFIDQVLAGLDNTCAIMDDVLVTGKDDAEHFENLDRLFTRFKKYQLRVKLEKCKFLQDNVVYMGRRLSAEGLQPTETKVEAIRKAPIPKNVTELRSWLGMVNFQGQFLPNLSTKLYPLNELLGNREWKWTSDCQASFDAVKRLITSDKLLVHYNTKLPLELATDASPYGVGAVIFHKVDGIRKPIAYASRSLHKHERNYAQLDKEALSIIFGVRRFRNYVYGRHFTILNDHKPLERILGSKTAIPTLAAQRLQRWAIELSALNYDLKYISSKENAYADALSRLPLPTTVSPQAIEFDMIYNIQDKILDSFPITSKQISTVTRTDPVLSRVLHYTKTGWPDSVDDERLKPYFQRRFDLTVEQDCILWGIRVVLPAKFVRDILAELHSSHPGIVRMKEIARSHVWWPNIDKDISDIVKSCSTCQQTRSLPASAPLMPWLWPGSPWTRVHIDYAEKDGKNYLIVVDSYSKWPECILMNSTTSQATIIVLRDLFSKYGIPSQLVSDNGPQFISEEFKLFLKRNGIKQVLVAPYHAASNGAAERMVQSFKRALSASIKMDLTLQHRIDAFLLSYRSTKHPTTGCTPAKLFLGREIRTRLSLLHPDVKSTVINHQSDQKTNHDNLSALREFYPGDSVLIKDFRHKGTWWPGTVAERTAPKSYVVVLRDGRVWKRHIDQMRKGDNSLEDNVIIDSSEGEKTEIKDKNQRNNLMVNPTDNTTIVQLDKPENRSQLKRYQQTSLPRVNWKDRVISDQATNDLNSSIVDSMADKSSNSRSDDNLKMSTPKSKEPDKRPSTSGVDPNSSTRSSDVQVRRSSRIANKTQRLIEKF